MDYVILRRDFEGNLVPIVGVGLAEIPEEKLDEYICKAYVRVTLQDIYGDENDIPDDIVICQVAHIVRDKGVDHYVKEVLGNEKGRKDAEDYATYLRLKQRFEQPSFDQ